MGHRGVEAWRELFKAQTRSGLTVTEFCRTQGLCAKSFWRSRKALGQALPSDSPSQFVRIEATAAASIEAPLPRFRLRLGRCEWELTGLPLKELIKVMAALA